MCRILQKRTKCTSSTAYGLKLSSDAHKKTATPNTWTALSEFGTYHLCEQRRFRRACASAQSRQNLRCSLIPAVSQEEPSDRKPDPWLLWMAGHAQLKFVMTECSKTQIRLTGPTYGWYCLRYSDSINKNARLQLSEYLVWWYFMRNTGVCLLGCHYFTLYS